MCPNTLTLLNICTCYFHFQSFSYPVSSNKQLLLLSSNVCTTSNCWNWSQTNLWVVLLTRLYSLPLVLVKYSAHLDIVLHTQYCNWKMKINSIRWIKALWLYLFGSVSAWLFRYCEKAFQRLGVPYDLSDEEISEAEAMIETHWRAVVGAYTVRLALAPLVEAYILLDRMLYLSENGQFFYVSFIVILSLGKYTPFWPVRCT